jgi:hypothetical protein
MEPALMNQMHVEEARPTISVEWTQRVGLVLLLATATVGCGLQDGLLPVTGEVTYHGKPLEYGTISFVSPHSRLASGEIKAGKIFGVTTKKQNDGLAPGFYQVTISATDRSEEYRVVLVPPNLIPDKYADYATSGLTATIERGKENVLSFALEE